jgi:hypothetical protein
MTYEEVRPFLGESCRVRMRCIACRDTHELLGQVQPAKFSGEVSLSGHTFSVEDIEAIWLQRPPTPPRRRRLETPLFRRLTQTSAGRA